MTLFILLLFFVFAHAQNKIPTKEEVRQKQREYAQEHHDSMKIYDRLYEIRQKRHNEWLAMMKKMEEQNETNQKYQS